MVFWKIWLDVRIRFYISLAIAVFITLGLIISFPFAGALVNYAKEDMTRDELATVQKYTTDYRLFMDEGWFNEIGFVSMLAIVLTLGGVMAEIQRRSVLLTLSLPVSRRDWVVKQGLFAALLLLLIAAACSFLILAGGWGMGMTFPLTRATAGTFLLLAGSFPWIGITLLVTAITQDRLKASVCSFLLFFLAGPLEKFSALALWMPESILKILEPGFFPWQAMLSILILTGGSWFAAIKIFENRDF